jgi:predicted dinucleotide-binding enzyme
MKIAIIGTGNVGSAIATGLSGKGHDIVLGVRSIDAAEVRTLAKETGSRLASPVMAAAENQMVILALPWNAVESVVKELGDLDGKVVLDCTNPLGMVDGQLGLLLGHGNSGGEQVQAWLPRARVVKSLNQIGAELMADNSLLPHRPVMFMAGNDEAAKAMVAALLTDLGFEPLDAGDIAKSRLLEPFGMTWINQALFRGKGRNWAFAAISG